jgi:hypothetical protein
MQSRFPIEVALKPECAQCMQSEEMSQGTHFDCRDLNNNEFPCQGNRLAVAISKANASTLLRSAKKLDARGF